MRPKLVWQEISEGGVAVGSRLGPSISLRGPPASEAIVPVIAPAHTVFVMPGGLEQAARAHRQNWWWMCWLCHCGLGTFAYDLYDSTAPRRAYISRPSPGSHTPILSVTVIMHHTSSQNFMIQNGVIVILKSDGDERELPRTEARVVDADGAVDYLAPAELVAPALVRVWKKKIATFLVKESGVIPRGEYRHDHTSCWLSSVHYFPVVKTTADKISDEMPQHDNAQADAELIVFAFVAFGQQFILHEFPKGYCLYVHQKGPKDSPRRDAYLYGGSLL